MTLAQFAACAIFLAAYLAIVSERLDKTKVALAGGSLMLLLRLVEQRTALHGSSHVAGVDWNTIFLLIGMMIIVGVTKHTGLLEWIAIRTAKAVRGHPLGIIIGLSAVTAVASAFLDNVTVVLIMTPMMILLCENLKMDPVPALVAIVLASNIGGTATLIGDPPNMMIGSAAQLSFTDFLRYDTPAAALVLGAFVVMLWVGLRPRLRVSPEARAVIMALDEREAIRDPVLLRKCLLVLSLALLGLVFHSHLGLEPATIALAAASLLLLLTMPTRAAGPALPADFRWYQEIEWPTIFFFIGLFIMVSALVELGVIGMVGRALVTFAGDNFPALAFMVLWFTGLAVAVVNNVALVAPMNALILQIRHDMLSAGQAAIPAAQFQALWWALSLGACLGANYTPVATAANVVLTDIAHRSGYPIPFVRFLKYSMPITTVSLLVATVYLWLVFFR